MSDERLRGAWADDQEWTTMSDDLRQRVSERLTVLREWRERMLVEFDEANDYVEQAEERTLKGEHTLWIGLSTQRYLTPAEACLICLDDPATVGILADLVRQRAPLVGCAWHDTPYASGWYTLDAPCAAPGEAWALAYLAVTEGEIGQD